MMTPGQLSKEMKIAWNAWRKLVNKIDKFKAAGHVSTYDVEPALWTLYSALCEIEDGEC